MKIFVTGATGFVGSAVVNELKNAGHSVLGFTRSEAGAEFLSATNVEVHRGDLDNLASLRDGAGQCDAVIHCAFGSDFSKLAASSAQDRKAIEALGSELAGSDRPLVITSVVMMGIQAAGRPAIEAFFDRNRPNPLRLTEIAGADVADRGVNVSVVRLPQVHNIDKQGIPGLLLQIAQQKKVSAYVGDGRNGWAAAHLLDVALLYRLVVEKHEAGSCYHAVGEESVQVRKIAERVGEKLGLPTVSISQEEGASHFGPLAWLVGSDLSASNRQTTEQLNWHPTGPTLLRDIEQAQGF